LHTRAKLLYLMTTPMMPLCCKGSPLLPAGEGSPPPGCNASDHDWYPCDGVVQRLNAAARTIMAARDVQVLDLHSVVTSICGATYVNCSICRMEPCSYHYNPGGYTRIAKPIADAIRGLIPQARRDLADNY